MPMKLAQTKRDEKWSHILREICPSFVISKPMKFMLESTRQWEMKAYSLWQNLLSKESQV